MSWPYSAGNFFSSATGVLDSLSKVASGNKALEIKPRPTGGYIISVVDKAR